MRPATLGDGSLIRLNRVIELSSGRVARTGRPKEGRVEITGLRW